MAHKFPRSEGGKILRELLHDGKWHDKLDLRDEWVKRISPHRVGRRKFRHTGSRHKDLAVFKHWLFANHVRYLVLRGHIERNVAHPLANTPWKARITAKGLAYYEKEQKRINNEN